MEKKKSKTKKRVLILMVIVFFLMCIPTVNKYRDGGTVEYRAVLYTYTKWHKLNPDGPEEYIIYNEFKLFPFNFTKPN